jgi:hypothetical protein
MLRNFFILIIVFISYGPSMAQPCCGAMSGGMGTAGSRFGLGTAAAGSFQFSLAYDMNYMNRLYDGTTRLDGNENERLIHSGIFELNYGINRRLSVAGTFTYLGQELASPRIDGGRQIDYIWGFGDIVLMVKYRLMNALAYNGWEVVAGAGPKIPTGNYSNTGSGGLLFPMDVQPGSGSLDAITWLSFSKTHLFISNLHLNSGLTYRFSGRNKNYIASQVYDFANEIQSTAGLSYNFYAGIVFDIFSFVRYRYQGNDYLGGEVVDMIGGHWLYISPGIKANLTQDTSLAFSVDMPLYQNLNGPQLTSTYRFSLGLIYNLSPRRSIEIGPGQ